MLPIQPVQSFPFESLLEKTTKSIIEILRSSSYHSGSIQDILSRSQLSNDQIAFMLKSVIERISNDLEEKKEIEILIKEVDVKDIENIKKLPENFRYEMAKFAAVQNGWEMSVHIEKYGLTKELDRYEVAKLAAVNSGEGTPEYIANYGLTEEHRYEVAKVVAAQDGRIALAWIVNYDLTEWHYLEVVKVVLVKDAENYDLTKELDRFALAKIAASQFRSGTSLHIARYDLTEEHRLEVAKTAAAKDGGGTSLYIAQYGLSKESDRFEIAKTAAAKDGGGTSLYIAKYDLTEEHRLEVAKIAAAQNGEETSARIANYSLKEEHRFEVAKLTAIQNRWEMSEHIANYGLTKESDRYEVAKFAAANSGERTLEYIANYGLTEEHRYEVAKVVAAQDGRITLEWIVNYDLTEWHYLEVVKVVLVKDAANYDLTKELDRFALAKIAASQFRSGTSLHIASYDLTEEHRLEVAKTTASQKRSGTSLYITKYGLSKESDRFEVAKIAAVKDGGETSERIANYSLKEEHRLEVAKIAAVQSGSETSRKIGKYGLTKESDRYEVAKIAAANCGEGMSECIANYRLTEEQCFEVAKIAAAQNGQGTSKHIDKYGLTKESDRFEVAKIAAAQNGNGTSEHIDKYGLTKESDRFEVAKIAAAQNGKGTSEHIDKYGLTKESDRFEVAITAAQDWWGSSEHIDKYGLTKESDRFEVAKIAAAHDGCGTSEHIDKYGLTKESDRFEIAKIAATKNGGDTSERIANYSLKEEYCFEVAKLAAIQNGWGTSEQISNYNLTEEHRYEIAMIAAAQESGGTSLHIKNYNLTKESDRYKVAKIAAACDGERTSEYIEKYGLTKEQDRLVVLKIALCQSVEALKCLLNYHFDFLWEIQDADFCNFVGMKKSFLEAGASEEDAQRIVHYIESIDVSDEREKKKVQYDMQLCMAYGIVVCQTQGLSFGDLCKENGWIDALLAFRSPKGRVEVLTDLSNYLTVDNFSDFQQQVLSVDCQDMLYQSYSWIMSKKGVVLHLPNKSTIKNMLLKRDVLSTLHALLSTQLDSKIIEKVVSSAVTRKSSGEVRRKLQSVVAIVNLKQQELLNNNSIEEAFEQGFQLTFSIAHIDGFEEKYFKTIAQFRHPERVMQYYVSLMRLPDWEREICLNSFSRYVECVLNGTLQVERIEKSPHLNELKKRYGSVSTSWTQSIKKTYGTEGVKKEVTKVDFIEQFKILFHDNHLTKEWFPDLYLFLTQGEEERIAIAKTVNDKIKECKDEKEKRKLLFEKKAIIFINKKAPDEQLAALNELEKAVPLSPEQLRHDIAAFKNSFEKPSSPRGEWIVTDSDDPCDLLECGTEIDGSCQRVDGEPNLNKALLSYLLDGKNRLIAIKNEKGEIQSRAFLRLLWDDTNKKPALFLERVYPKTGPKEWSNAILSLAKEKAKIMNLSLYSKEVGSGSLFTGRLSSFGSPAPYEYVDAGDGINNGQFTLSNCHKII